MKKYNKKVLEGFASQGSHISKQIEIDINGKKHKIKIYSKTWYGNPSGWDITIDGEKFFVNVLTQEEAIEKAVSKYKKKHGLIEKQDDIQKGDLVYSGRWKNKKLIVKDFDVDDKGQPVIVPEKGKPVKVYNVRIDKLLPKKEKEMKKYNKLKETETLTATIHKVKPTEWYLQISDMEKSSFLDKYYGPYKSQAEVTKALEKRFNNIVSVDIDTSGKFSQKLAKIKH